MIEKITTKYPDFDDLKYKINEIIDWINDVSALRVTDKQVTANLPNIDAGELAFLSKENSDLKDELERTRKALEIAVDALKDNLSQANFTQTIKPTKKVLQIKDNKIIKEFNSVKDAKESIMHGKRHIYDCCLGTRKYAGGYQWKYKN